MNSSRDLRKRLGNPVKGTDFWPRADVVDNLLEDLVEDKGSRRIFSLRRIGKTSVLFELVRRLRERQDLTVIYCDVQGISRFKDFLIKFYEQLPVEGRFKKARQKFAANTVVQGFLAPVLRRVGGSNTVDSSPGFQNEFDHAAAWAGDIEEALKEAGPIVLIVDELPYMLRNMMRDGYKPWDAERFLATLRDWRINCGVRMLLSGSIGFAQLSRLDGVHVADHIGDVVPVRLPPLERSAAVDMVDALARGEGTNGWTQALSEAVVEASAETWPIFLQYGFDAVVKSGVRDPAAVKATIDAGVRQALDENFYQQFTTRLSRYKTDEKAARVILKAVAAVAPEPLTFQAVDEALAKVGAVERRDDVLEALREDDFILFDTETQTVRLASKLVPIWIRARAWGR